MSDEDEEAPGTSGAVAPSAPRLTVDQVAATVTGILPASWAGHPIAAEDADLAEALGALLADGWSRDSLRDACADLGRPVNPTRLLIAHLRRLLGKPKPVRVAAQPAPVNPLQQVNKNRLRKFTRSIGADPAQLTAAVGALAADGLDVGIDLGDDKGALHVGTPEVAAHAWDVSWVQREDRDESQLTGRIWGVEDDAIRAAVAERLGDRYEPETRRHVITVEAPADLAHLGWLVDALRDAALLIEQLEDDPLELIHPDYRSGATA